MDDVCLSSSGVLYPWTSAGSPTLLSDTTSSEAFRTLLRFENLNQYIPSYSNVLDSNLTLTFTNWGVASTVELCLMTKKWDTSRTSG